MGENTNGKTKKTPGLGLALLPLAFMFVVLFLGLIIFSIDIKILLLICAAFTIVLCLFLGYTWKDVENEIVELQSKNLMREVIKDLELNISDRRVDRQRNYPVPGLYRTSDH